MLKPIGRFLKWALISLALLLVFAVYIMPLQTIVNGSEHYYMIDVGETQAVLNLWGTLHATGYPLYVMLSSAGVALLKWVGMSPVTAPSFMSFIYGMLALVGVYRLMTIIGRGKPTPLQVDVGEVSDAPLQAGRMYSAPILLPLLVTIAFAVTRTVWVHNLIAEIYSFGLLISIGLLLIALWPRPMRGRVYWLALLGGVGAFHHRAIVMLAPALIFAVWPEVRALLWDYPHPASPASRGEEEKATLIPSPSTERVRVGMKAVPRLLTILTLGLLGFLPYAYLPLRASAGAAWVYGEPGTWTGFWDQFFGREASRFIGSIHSWDGLVANFSLINNVLITDLTAPGLLVGILGIFLALRNPARRRFAGVMLLTGGVAYAFHVLFYSDILSALILPILLMVACGWLWALEWFVNKGHLWRWLGYAALIALIGALLWQNGWNFLYAITHDETGLQTINIAKSAPFDSTLMLDWGPRYFAVAVAKDVLGELPGITLVNHKADFPALVAAGAKLVTPEFTFYNRPVSWWQGVLGQKVYLSSPAPYLVALNTAPIMAQTLPESAVGVIAQKLTCEVLEVTWAAKTAPTEDLSVFVHLLDADGKVIAQADVSAPVYGWRPLTTWTAGEAVRDFYPIDLGVWEHNQARSIHYGLYHQLADGSFENVVEYTLSTNPLDCQSFSAD